MDFIEGEDGVAPVFEAGFAASEGAQAGRAIARLVRRLQEGRGDDAATFFAMRHDGLPVAAICFTPLRFADPARRVALLSPVAVVPARQGRGIGSRLIRHGLGEMAARRVEAVVTYGDPAFYGRFGFRQTTPSSVPAPYPLSQPEGWQIRAAGGECAPLRGPARCVPAFEDAELW